MKYWKVTESEGSIVITTFGHDKVGTWPAAVVEFGAHITRLRQEVRVIADLREMTGYETGARRAWQEAFREHRHLMQGWCLSAPVRRHPYGCCGGRRRRRGARALRGRVGRVEKLRF